MQRKNNNIRGYVVLSETGYFLCLENKQWSTSKHLVNAKMFTTTSPAEKARRLHTNHGKVLMVTHDGRLIDPVTKRQIL